MNVIDIIRRKRDGNELTKKEIQELVTGIASNEIPDYQLSAWAMAVYFKSMNTRETVDLTMAMAASGQVMDLSAIAGIKVDKHSTGGVGDKTTMIVMPLAAAAGVPVAKMSGHGLGHTGGTIDKFEAIPGFQVEMEYQQFIDQVNRIKAAIISSTGDLVPADKRLYALRDVTATVDSIPLIASSIMSKKIACGAQGIVLDVKMGEGAFMQNLESSLQLARAMVDIGKESGRQVVALITDMNQPLGTAIGNSLEVIEAIDTLKGEGPDDLTVLSIEIAAYMVLIGGRAASIEEARELVQNLLYTGRGLEKFLAIVAAQGGRLDLDKNDYGLGTAPRQIEVKAEQTGYLQKMNALHIGKATMLLGAGREKIGDVIDYTVGLKLLHKPGDYVQKGEPLAVIHAAEKNTIAAEQMIMDSLQWSREPVNKP
ncbi:MAG: pyrimidine-nucleoside phosphorylase, partial [Syntrophomonadaceae bacterium]|nr:pyrimidine-nucleoside phosphorylase [Syntrophomonadaceae bacterium]